MTSFNFVILFLLPLVLPCFSGLYDNLHLIKVPYLGKKTCDRTPRPLFDVMIKSSSEMDQFVVEDVPDLSQMTLCMWVRIEADWQNNPNKRMYLVAYDLDINDELKANSFFLDLDNDKNLAFGIGNGAQTCDFKSSLENNIWQHICIVWGEGSGYTSYYRNGSEVKFESCGEGGPRAGGGKLQLGGGERTDSVVMTSFNLWNRMLTETEIAKEAKTCDGGQGKPVAQWRQFYKKSLSSQFIREESQCAAPGEAPRKTLANKEGKRPGNEEEGKSPGNEEEGKSPGNEVEAPANKEGESPGNEVAAPARVRCRSGWDRYESFCYLADSYSTTWQGAQQYCESLGADLVKIDNAAENNFVLQLVRKKASSAKQVWIGLKWTSNAFHWRDQSVPVYTNWAKDEPNGRAQEPCTNMWIEHKRHKSQNGKWNDRPCKKIRRYPCGFVCKGFN